MGADKPTSAPAVRAQNHSTSARCDSPAFGFSDPRLADEGEPPLPLPVFCTLEEVAAKLGMQREQVRVIEQRALRKCRAYCAVRGLRLEDLLTA